MIFLVNLLIIFGLLYLGSRWVAGSDLRGFFWPAALLKMLMGALVGLLYMTYYEGGDTFSFFSAAIEFKNVAFQSFSSFIDLFLRNRYAAIPGFQYGWIPSAFFVKVLALLALLTRDNYWLSSIYLSLFSFSGLWLWTIALYRLTDNKGISIASGYLFPSVLFWSSGIMKEALAIPALAILLALFIKFYLGDKLTRRHLATAVVMFIILAVLKYFVAAILLVVIGSIMLSRRFLGGNLKPIMEVAILVTVVAVLGGIVSLLHPNLWLTRMAEVIYNNYQAYIAISSAGGVILFDDLKPELLSMVFYLPKAVFAGLFSPIWPIAEVPISYASVIENWILLYATMGSLFALRVPLDRDKRLLVWGGLVFVLISAWLITLSTPNLGTLARYKSSYLVVFAPIVITGIIRAHRKILAKP